MNYNIDNIGYLLNKASKSIRWQLNRRLGDYNLTSAQWAVLKDLQIFDKEDKLKFATSASIAERLNVDRPTMSGIVNRLLKNGWITTETNPEDRRSQIINLTEKSWEILSELEVLSDDTITQALEGFSKNEINALKQLLIKIVDNLT